MSEPREVLRSGLDSVEAITALLQRAHMVRPPGAIYQAAEIQFWWGRLHSTDTLDQLFWVDDDDAPIAAVVANDFGGGESIVYDDTILVVIVLPDAPPDWLAHVVRRGLEHVAAAGITGLELEIDRADTVLRDIMVGHGFELREPAVVECWLDATNRPQVSPLADGYELVSRSDVADRPHHMADERRPGIEERLTQTSLYRPDLDLAVYDRTGEPAAHGMFWLDPVTSTGVVEPMRTHDDHQQRGLARHILTEGVDRLAAAGAERISIGYEPDNPASGHLYRSVGFVPHAETDLFGRADS